LKLVPFESLGAVSFTFYDNYGAVLYHLRYIAT